MNVKMIQHVDENIQFIFQYILKYMLYIVLVETKYGSNL